MTTWLAWPYDCVTLLLSLECQPHCTLADKVLILDLLASLRKYGLLKGPLGMFPATFSDEMTRLKILYYICWVRSASLLLICFFSRNIFRTCHYIFTRTLLITLARFFLQGLVTHCPFSVLMSWTTYGICCLSNLDKTLLFASRYLNTINLWSFDFF